jgi:hypothetical protein
MRATWILLLAGCGFQAQLAALDGTRGGASAPDAAFDFAACPGTYNTALPGLPAQPAPSRYRLIVNGGPAANQSDLCNDDMSGATHLVVLDSMEELVAVAALVDAAANNAITHNSVWVGGVQSNMAKAPSDAWLGFDDQPLIPRWAQGEPNDGGGTEDHMEQFVLVLRGKPYLTDATRNTSSGALCECDGRAVGPMAAEAIAANR